MPTLPAPVVYSLELGLALVGAMLLWRYAFSPTARAEPRSARLSTWEAPLSDFMLFLWCVFCGGLVLPLIAQFAVARPLGLEGEAKTVLMNGCFQGGMLLGVGAHWFLFGGGKQVPPPTEPWPLAPALAAGFATFLMCLPLVLLVTLAWGALLNLVGIPRESQDAITFFRTSKSPLLIGLMAVFATVIAPITEELIFRSGMFRFVRTRLPRWAGLLLPACLFAALHGHLPSFAPLVVLGLVFSLAYERTGRIGTSMVAHATFNLHNVVLLFIAPDLS